MTRIMWRDYDRDELDRQFNLRARTPEHVDFFARWEAEGAAARAELAGQLDLSYGDGIGERLDLFCATGRKAPLLVFIHGGYWQSLDKGHYSQFARAFHDAGIAYASMNYTLAPQAQIPQMVVEIRRGLAWLYNNADLLGFDRQRMLVAGHSAGGHLAAMALATDWSEAWGLPQDIIKGAVSISGIYQLEPLRHSYQQPVLQLDAESARTWSPQHNVPRNGQRPLVLAVGSEEPEEFQLQQAEFANVWAEAGHPVEEMILAGRHHFNAVEALAEKAHPLYVAACRLADRSRLDRH